MKKRNILGCETNTSHLNSILSYLNTSILLASLIMSLSNVSIFASLTTASGRQALLQEQLFNQIQKGNQAEVESLLQANANLYDRDDLGSTPLHSAVLFNQIGIAYLLIEKKANINAQNIRDGATPLHDAAYRVHLNIVKLLLHEKADISLHDKQGKTPLDQARDDNQDNIPLHQAQKEDRTAIIELLLRASAQPRTCIDSDVIREIEVVTEESEAQRKLELELEKSKGDLNAALLQVQESHKKLVEAEEQLHKAEAQQKAQAEYDQQLIEAAKDGNKPEVERLLTAGANIYAIDGSYYTPLHYAALKGHKEVAESLINKGILINAINKSNCTPLHTAAMCGHKDVVDCLIANKANIEAVDKDGMTPLHWAVFWGYIEVVKLLLEKGAKKNVVDTLGITPRGLATNGEIVALLK